MERPQLALLLCCLLRVLSLAGAVPLERDSVSMRAKVRLNAEQLAVRLDMYLKRLNLSPGLSPPNDPLDGLSSMVVVLEGYESLLSESLEGLAQPRQEVSSLRGYLTDWREVHCGEQQRSKPPLSGRLAMLQSRKEYVETVGIEAALGLREYLGSLLKNLDLLGTC